MLLLQQKIVTEMLSITGIRFFIEFSSILVLAFLCLMHEFTDMTLAKQFHFDHTSSSNQQSFDEVEQTSSLDFSSTLSLKIDDKPYVEFMPESLDFGHHSIGTPVIETVFVRNNHEEINVQMISISGNTEHFHCSFFEDKILSPRSNTTFQVVFLARQEGLVNNTLYIHSSVGSFQLRVSAFGEISPFRIRPLIGARVPLNSSFASLISIYNPFSTPLQLTEMYTSGGGLHLELPDNDYEALSSAWKIPPYETRSVMKAHFVARTASNHTSYIRIRTNQSDIQLVLPVEVEVSNLPGLYSPLDTLDFGVLRAKHDPPKTLPILVINAALKSIVVQSIVVTPNSEGLILNYNGPVKLTPQSSSPYHVADLVLDPGQFSCFGFCFGKVLIKSKNNQYKLTIPFVVRIIQGELYYNKSQSHFFIDSKSSCVSEERILNVENRFESSLVVHDILLPDEAKPYFRLSINNPYQLPFELPVNQPFPLLHIEFTPSQQLSHFSTTFRLLTNLSYFDLPLYAYKGKLDLFIPNSQDQSKLDIGVVGLNEHKSSTLVVANHNPIAIRLIYWQCNITGISVELVGTSHGNISSVSQRIIDSSTISRTKITWLESKHFAIFRVHVNKLSNEGSLNGIVTITTAFEQLVVPLMLRVLRGSLSSEPVILSKTFPGKIVKSLINIKSNYTSNIKIKGAFIEPKDDRFKIKLIDQLIKPGQDNQLQITFDASAACFQKLCYSALDIEKEVGHLWLLGSGLYSDTAYIDKELYKLLRNQWLSLSEEDRNPLVHVRLQVDGFGSFITPAQAQQHWPRLANKLVIRFPSIRVGQKVTKELLIENTADRSVLIQAINVIDYPNSEVLLQLISSSIFHQQWSKNDLQAIHSAIRNHGHNTSVFLLTNNTVASTSQVQQITEWLGVEPNSNSYIMLLPPGVRHRLAVNFNPLDEKNYTSLLILRNNLTIIDVVMLRGEGGRGLLKIGKTLPNQLNSRLVFEFTDRTLERRCRNLASKSLMKPINYNALVIKERFKAVNIGRMPLQIRSFLIDGMHCEGFGFRISRCEPVLLLPNQTFEIEIIYSPDFTQPSITHELTILVDDDTYTAQRFILVASIPKRLLDVCLNALPRPPWEELAYFILVAMALFVLVLSIIVAVFDAHRITYNFYLAQDYQNNDKLSNSNKEELLSDLVDENINNKYDNPVDLSKKRNGHLICNGHSNHQMNSKVFSNSVNQQSLNNNTTSTKVRNRRNKNITSNGVLNSSTPATVSNGHVMRGNNQAISNGYKQSKSASIPHSTQKHQEWNKNKAGTKNEDLMSLETYPDFSCDNDQQWSKDHNELSRQDSSSSSSDSIQSHHHRSSSDNNISSTSRISAEFSGNKNYWNHSPSDSINDETPLANNYIKNNKISQKSLTVNSKESLPSSSLESLIKSMNVSSKQKTNNQKQLPANKSQNLKENLFSSVMMKKDKSMEKHMYDDGNSATPSESTKSSTESLNFGTAKYESNNNINNSKSFSMSSNATKQRSATMPTNSNNQFSSTVKNTPSYYHNAANKYKEVESLIFNQSRMMESSNDSSLKKNNSFHDDSQLFDGQEIKNWSREIGKNVGRKVLNNSELNNKFDVFRKVESAPLKTCSNDDSRFYEQQFKVKDIWDSPITNFDAETAMNLLVKQTEEFDEKNSSINYKDRVSFANRKITTTNNNISINNKSLATTINNDDKWEIGEWSNDFLMNGIADNSNASNFATSHNSRHAFGKYNSFGNNDHENRNISHTSHNNNSNNNLHRLHLSETINYQEYRNRLNDKNNGNFLKTIQKLVNNNNKATVCGQLNNNNSDSPSYSNSNSTSISDLKKLASIPLKFSPVIEPPSSSLASNNSSPPLLPNQTNFPNNNNKLSVSMKNSLTNNNKNSALVLNRFNGQNNFDHLNSFNEKTSMVKTLSLDSSSTSLNNNVSKPFFLDNFLSGTNTGNSGNNLPALNSSLIGPSGTAFGKPNNLSPFFETDSWNTSNSIVNGINNLCSNSTSDAFLPTSPLSTTTSSMLQSSVHNKLNKPSTVFGNNLFDFDNSVTNNVWSSSAWDSQPEKKTSDIFTPSNVLESNFGAIGSPTPNSSWTSSSNLKNFTSPSNDLASCSSNNINNNSRVWPSSFDKFYTKTNFDDSPANVPSSDLSMMNNSLSNKNLSSTDSTKMPSSSSYFETSSNTSLFEWFGKSPWTPLGSSPIGAETSSPSTNTSNAGGNPIGQNFLSSSPSQETMFKKQ